MQNIYQFCSFNGQNELYYQLIKKYNIKKIKKEKNIIVGMQNCSIHLYKHIPGPQKDH